MFNHRLLGVGQSIQCLHKIHQFSLASLERLLKFLHTVVVGIDTIWFRVLFIISNRRSQLFYFLFKIMYSLHRRLFLGFQLFQFIDVRLMVCLCFLQFLGVRLIICLEFLQFFLVCLLLFIS
ncbi:hypothetical protein K450DRAFT_254107 [Umbelopsis ramanniana AG]|uniref:Uncharacterized protein n=1 Tax=Umbelopsis ramanniana AG TaxID=1314678 RepID=A0AAD5E4J9_UMBRA|nr:uncharacterized protein K450DRAFT_254107 [Umbelopsis ramanniana AG]KAI8577043.1 hypothetical protein K450DRAFT_254107 [Umbelopsis ramanniana AG]